MKHIRYYIMALLALPLMASAAMMITVRLLPPVIL